MQPTTTAVVAQSSNTLVSIPSGCWLLIISPLTMIHTVTQQTKNSGNSMISSQSKQGSFLCSTRLCQNFCMGGSAIEYFNTQKLVCNCKISHCLSYLYIFCRGGLLHWSLPLLAEPPPPAGRMHWEWSWAIYWTSLSCRPQRCSDYSPESHPGLCLWPPVAGPTRTISLFGPISGLSAAVLQWKRRNSRKWSVQ